MVVKQVIAVAIQVDSALPRVILSAMFSMLVLAYDGRRLYPTIDATSGRPITPRHDGYNW